VRVRGSELSRRQIQGRKSSSYCAFDLYAM